MKLIFLFLLLLVQAAPAFAAETKNHGCDRAVIFARAQKVVEENYPGKAWTGLVVKESVRFTEPLPEEIVRETGGVPLIAVFRFQYVDDAGPTGDFGESAMQLSIDRSTCQVNFVWDGRLDRP